MTPRRLPIWRHTERGRQSVRLAMRRWRKRHPIEHRQEVMSRKYLLKVAGPRISSTEWQQMLEQFHHRCFYCGRADVELTMDHLVAVRLGGTNANYNIVPACRSCNSRKRAMTAVDFINIVERVA